MERKTAFKSLVGSHNYNLNTGEITDASGNVLMKESDKDYKAFLIPTFDDLYNGKMYAKQIVGETEDIDFHDIRKLPELFFKANINYLEVLFSKSIFFTGDLTLAQLSIVESFFHARHEISTMNLPHLFKACKGMYFNKMNLLKKGTEGTQYLVDLYGYDTKQALHAFRLLNFIARFKENGFSNFEDALRYNKERAEFLFEIKNGHMPLKEFTEFVEEYYNQEFIVLEDDYNSFTPNLEIKRWLENQIKVLVQLDIQGL